MTTNRSVMTMSAYELGQGFGELLKSIIMVQHNAHIISLPGYDEYLQKLAKSIQKSLPGLKEFINKKGVYGITQREPLLKYKTEFLRGLKDALQSSVLNRLGEEQKIDLTKAAQPLALVLDVTIPDTAKMVKGLLAATNEDLKLPKQDKRERGSADEQTLFLAKKDTDPVEVRFQHFLKSYDLLFKKFEPKVEAIQAKANKSRPAGR